MKRNSGFTLVEILIVVIILGILAAIVIPQFTEASNDARQSALTSDLQTVRSQLELYRVQHNENYPAAATFVTQMTSRTDAAGNMWDGTAATMANFPFGPYVQKFPTNSFVSTVANQGTVGTGTADPAPGDAKTGWYFNTTTGKFSANDSAANAAL